MTYLIIQFPSCASWTISFNVKPRRQKIHYFSHVTRTIKLTFYSDIIRVVALEWPVCHPWETSCPRAELLPTVEQLQRYPKPVFGKGCGTCLCILSTHMNNEEKCTSTVWSHAQLASFPSRNMLKSNPATNSVWWSYLRTIGSSLE